MSSYIFTQIELSQIEAAANLADANPITHPWYEVYDLVVNILENPQGTVIDQDAMDVAIKWFNGAADVNRNSSLFATFIRSYSNREMWLHFGSIPADVQDASDEIAKRAILTSASSIVETGSLALIHQIAEDDASGTGAKLFTPFDDDDTASHYNSGWAGALLFTALGDNQTWRLLKSSSSDTENTVKLNTLEDLRNILYAVDAIYYAWNIVFANEISWTQKLEALLQMGIPNTFAENILNGESPVELLINFLAGGTIAGEYLNIVKGNDDRLVVLENLIKLFNNSDIDINAGNFDTYATQLFNQLETQGKLSLEVTFPPTLEP